MDTSASMIAIVLISMLAGCRSTKPPAAVAIGPDLSIARDGHWLVITSDQTPEIRINYLEAYCRPGSTDADWVKQTVIKHKTEDVEVPAGGKRIVIRDTLADGVIVDHTITAGRGEIDFRVVAHNPTNQPSLAHWAQPCVRLGLFCGFADPPKNSPTDYLGKCFIYRNGKQVRMPFEPWATEARYVPGQVWCPAHVPRADVNPRPLSPVVPSNGLIGCESGDGKFLFATAWEPYQELFQGVARCLHSDFRIGGLAAGETKVIRGKVYVVPNDEAALLTRYQRDFPEHIR
ncbi:hypothetical protein [Humisphaera borealis]|uniref:Uncharacterized protein n=1 Tax=Humisphaera borealis TaxID=2807512 RepID=A0A7M2X2P5_9BACT|nr:hypothetical protein [Humisphaera borealis]QOV91030.1 hypothetical protein IPV69_06625 [Humisphaera borealis]